MKTVRTLPRLFQKFPGMNYEIILLMDRSWYCKRIMTELCMDNTTHILTHISTATPPKKTKKTAFPNIWAWLAMYVYTVLSTKENVQQLFFLDFSAPNCSRRWGFGPTAPQHTSRTAWGWSFGMCRGQKLGWNRMNGQDQWAISTTYAWKIYWGYYKPTY